MGCNIAENSPLRKLRQDLGLAEQCHSARPYCLRGQEARKGEYAFGIPGTVIGYCQALFNYAGSPSQHTERVVRLLNEVEAPWASSHELFWGFRDQETPEEFVRGGIRPLLGKGRVPILITALDPAQDQETIASIVSTSPEIHAGETVLIRIVLSSDESVHQSALLINKLLEGSKRDHAMPCWWPLIQGNINTSQWQTLKHLLGSAWEYVNIAVNPFTSEETWDCVREQVTVGQIPLGLVEGVHSDSTIQLAPGMKIAGAAEGAIYSIETYMQQLQGLSVAPTLIVLGPSQQTWTDEMNQKRIQALLPILRSACNTLWSELPSSRREYIWGLAA